MKLYTAYRAPNPRRVAMFLAEKGMDTVERVLLDLNAGAHRDAAFIAKNPMARVPVLELDDGRLLCESRAICTYLEGLVPEPNLMGATPDERAFVEMADRWAELHWLVPITNSIRHAHPGLAALEQPQFPDFGRSQADLVRAMAGQLDQRLQQQPWMAGARFTIADITAFCALEFARGLMQLVPAELGLAALQGWRDRVAARPSAHLKL